MSYKSHMTELLAILRANSALKAYVTNFKTTAGEKSTKMPNTDYGIEINMPVGTIETPNNDSVRGDSVEDSTSTWIQDVDWTFNIIGHVRKKGYEAEEDLLSSKHKTILDLKKDINNCLENKEFSITDTNRMKITSISHDEIAEDEQHAWRVLFEVIYTVEIHAGFR